MSIQKEITDAFARLIGNQEAFSEKTGISQATVSRYKRGAFGAENLVTALDALGAKIIFPDQRDLDQSRDVCFVNAKVVNGDEGAPPIIPDEYLAIPLTSEAGAGPGVIPYTDHESWFLVYRNEPSIRLRTNLIAVRIAGGSTSMEPTLHPGDIVLVDRNDKAVTTPGRIWLVMEPGQEGGAKVKRVKIDDVRARKQIRITYYSDNVIENPPEVFSLEEDFDGDISRAIVGRVVWAWSDLSRK